MGTWEGHLRSSFLVFRGTFLELSQSYSSCPALPEDPGRLAASGYPGPVLLLNFAGLFNDLFAGNLNINRALMLILLAAWIGPSFHGMGILVKLWPSTNPNFKLNGLNLEWKEVGELPENKKCQCKTAKHKIKEFWKLERDSNNNEWIWKREQVLAAIEGEAFEGGCETLCIWSTLPLIAYFFLIWVLDFDFGGRREFWGPFGYSFQKLLFKKIWKLWFKKCCWKTYF